MLIKNGNKYLFACALGALATVSGEISSKILTSLGIGKYNVYELNSLLILSDQPQFFIGMFINLIIGGIVAALLYHAFEKWLGTSLIIIKCVIGSWLVWLVYEIIFTAMIEGNTIQIRPIIDHVVHIIATAAYGCTLGILLNKFIFKRQGKCANV